MYLYASIFFFPFSFPLLHVVLATLSYKRRELRQLVRYILDLTIDRYTFGMLHW